MDKKSYIKVQLEIHRKTYFRLFGNFVHANLNQLSGEPAVNRLRGVDCISFPPFSVHSQNHRRLRA